MRTMEQRPRRPIHTGRIAGHAQQDHVLDPYEGQQKLQEGTVCPQCGAAFHDRRWQWVARPQAAVEALCAACRRINDKLPAGTLTLRGAFARGHKDELIHLARHQEQAEKQEHPLNRIMSIEEDAEGITINTTDIHLPRDRRDGQARLARQSLCGFRGGRIFCTRELEPGNLIGSGSRSAGWAWPILITLTAAPYLPAAIDRLSWMAGSRRQVSSLAPALVRS